MIANGGLGAEPPCPLVQHEVNFTARTAFECSVQLSNKASVFLVGYRRRGLHLDPLLASMLFATTPSERWPGWPSSACPGPRTDRSVGACEIARSGQEGRARSEEHTSELQSRGH